MGYSAQVGSFNLDTTKTAGQTQAVSGVGFQPKIVLFFWGGSTGTSDTVAGGTYRVGFGGAVSSSERYCTSSISIDAQGTSDCARTIRNDACIVVFNTTGALDGVADLASLDADGFTLTIDDQFASAWRISYLALGGTDLTNVKMGEVAQPGATGNYSTTGVGFQPDALLIASDHDWPYTDIYTTACLNLGMATGASNQGTVAIMAKDNEATTAAYGYGYNGEVMSYVWVQRDAFVSFDADGFTFNCLEFNTSTYLKFYIALKGGQYFVGNLNTRTDGDDISETVGFKPSALLFASANRALNTQDAFEDPHARLSIGAATSISARACIAISDEHNLADSETAYANYDSAVYAHIADDALVALMDLKSIDASGFTCVMDDAEAGACWVTYLAMGAVAVAAPPRPSAAIDSLFVY